MKIPFAIYAAYFVVLYNTGTLKPEVSRAANFNEI